MTIPATTFDPLKRRANAKGYRLDADCYTPSGALYPCALTGRFVFGGVPQHGTLYFDTWYAIDLFLREQLNPLTLVEEGRE